MCSFSRNGVPSKVRVMSNAPSPYFQLRSRNGIITRPSGMNSPLNQAMRLFERAALMAMLQRVAVQAFADWPGAVNSRGGDRIDIMPHQQYVMTYGRANDRTTARRPGQTRQAQGRRRRPLADGVDRGWAATRPQRTRSGRQSKARLAAGEPRDRGPDAGHRPQRGSLLAGDRGSAARRAARVILPDVNVLIYAFRADLPQHAVCKRWLDRLVTADAQFGMSPLALS